MSHDATTWARTQKTGSSSAKFILMLLADYAGTDYSCYPSVRKLAADAEMGESTVRQATKLLAELGLIRVFYRHKASGLRRSCRYQLLVDGPDTAEPDAEDWANHRQISADDNRQDPADDAPDPGASVRQDLAVIPYKDPSLKEPPVMNPGASRTARATRVPDDFYPDAQMQAWFREQGYDRIIPNPKAAHEDFMDYWRAKSGADARKIDWPATWRRWMRTTADRAGRTSYGGGHGPRLQSTTDLKVQQTLDLAEQFRQMEENK